MQPPRFPVISNVTGEEAKTPEEIRRTLRDQVTGTVRWTDCMERLIGLGCDFFIELGPGGVLAGLLKRTNRSMRSFRWVARNRCEIVLCRSRSSSRLNGQKRCEEHRTPKALRAKTVCALLVSRGFGVRTPARVAFGRHRQFRLVVVIVPHEVTGANGLGSERRDARERRD